MRYKDLDKYIEEHGLLKNIKKTSGIYAITLEDFVVYVGQSKDMFQRCSQHIYNTENAMLNQEKKYLLLLSAKIGGHDIDYIPLEYCEESELTSRENFYISSYNPPLNILTPNGKQDIEVLKIGDLLSYIDGQKLEAIKHAILNE